MFIEGLETCLFTTKKILITNLIQYIENSNIMDEEKQIERSSEDSCCDRSDDNQHAPFLEKNRYRDKNQPNQLIGNMAFQAAILFFVFSIIILFATFWRRPSDQECLAQLSVYCEYPSGNIIQKVIKDH
jgi:hypothetical protein